MTPTRVERFVSRLTSLKGQAHVVKNFDEAAAAIVGICTFSQARCVALGELPEALARAVSVRASAAGIEVLAPPYAYESLPAALDRAQVGVGLAAFGIAATGTLVEVALDDAIRLVSALPRTYIGVVAAGNLMDTLEDSVPRLRTLFENYPGNCVVSFISGPSRTGDIEMILTLGVHGPEFAHAILIENWDEAHG